MTCSTGTTVTMTNVVMTGKIAVELMAAFDPLRTLETSFAFQPLCYSGATYCGR
jgi:hypothetical protein